MKNNTSFWSQFILAKLAMMPCLFLILSSIVGCSDDDNVIDPTPVSSSISIIASDFPIVGDVIERKVDTIPNYDIGEAGEDVTWDFTNLTDGFPITNELLAPENTPYADVYSAANVALVGGGGFTFYHISDTEINSIGFIGNVSIVGTQDTLVASNPVLNYEFPIQYNSTSADSYFLLIDIDSMPPGLPADYTDIRVKTNVSVTDIIDGWGTVKMPLGDYESLRNKRTETFFNEIEAYSQSEQQWIILQTQEPETSVSYRWLTKESKLPLIEYIFEPGDVPSLFIWNLILPQ